MRKSLVAVVGLSLVVPVLSSCGGSSSTADSSTSSAPEITTTTIPTVVDVYPLLGTPVASSDTGWKTRPALVAKIDNHPMARPQSGLNLADIVFEENVEQLTRYAAVFHSQGSDPVGPLRSGRTQDVDLLGALVKPLFVWSGGNAKVTQAINSSDLVNLGWSASKGKGGYYRDKSRVAPHNLYAKTTNLWKLAPATAVVPPAQFIYRGQSDALPTTLLKLAGMKVFMDNCKVYWKWDEASMSFLRYIENTKRVLEAHNTMSGTSTSQVTASNVVILSVEYKRSPADPKSPEAQTIGKGNAIVLTSGGAVAAKWSRANRLDPFTITDAAGSIIRLTPGRTWVELARVKKTAPVPVGVDPKSVAWPR